MLKAPKFWYKKNNTIYSNALYPFSLLFRLGTKLRNFFSSEKHSSIPIICIGNIVVGGAGKTPVSMKICKMLIKAGYNPHFISKGYAGVVVPSMRTPKSIIDLAKKEFGNEAMVLDTIDII